MKSKKWMLDIQKFLGVDDSIQEFYEGWLNGEYIFMVFTEKKIIIVEEPSLGVQKTRVSLHLPYSRIKKVTLEKPDVNFIYGLAFTDQSDFKRVFYSEYDSTAEIEDKLRELMERSAPSQLIEHAPYP